MNRCHVKVAAIAVCLLCTAIMKFTQAEDATRKVNVMQTPSGIEFGMMGTKGSAPAPTLFVFATEYEPTLTSAGYNGIGAILRKHGWLSVSLSLPYHPGGGLPGWASFVCEPGCVDARA